MQVLLNGNYYNLRGDVTRSTLAEWADNIRLDGIQKRKDRRYMSAYAMDAWSNGLGLQRQNLDLIKHQYRLWDVENCDTRHDFGIILSPAFNTCTIVPSRGDLELQFDYLGQLYFAQVTGTIKAGAMHQFSPPFTLGSYKYLSDTTNNFIRAIKSFGSDIVHIRAGGVTATFSVAKVASLGAGAETVLGLCDMVGSGILPQLGDMGGTLHVLNYHPVTKRLSFYLGDAALGTLHGVASMAVTMGTYLPPLVTDGLTMFAYGPRGVYNFDLTPSIIVDTSRAQDLNGALAIWGQDLLFKSKTSLMKRSSDGAELTSIGYDTEDGLTSDKMGQITALCSSWKYQFAAVKGATYSHILAMDTNDKWSYYTRIPTAGIWVKEMFLSDLPDAIDRLWCIFGNSPGVGYFLNPIVNPLQAGTYSYVASGYATFPEFDGGMPEEAGAFFGLKVNGNAIDSSNFINCQYGLNGANPVSSLGNATSLNSSFVYGNPYGLEGYRIQHKFGLARYAASSGTTPVFNSAILNYLKIPSEREAYDFTIDLKATSNERTRPLETVISELDTVRSSRVLVPFQYGQIATKNVKVLEAPETEETNVKTKQVYQGEREGFLRIRVAEII